MTNPTTHIIDYWSIHFQPIWEKKNRAMLLKNDCDYKVNNFINLQEWDPVKEKYTGRSLVTKITYILESEILPKSYVILSLSEPVSRTQVMP